jgi:D-lyxose ketol-isomerase
MFNTEDIINKKHVQIIIDESKSDANSQSVKKTLDFSVIKDIKIQKFDTISLDPNENEFIIY